MLKVTYGDIRNPMFKRAFSKVSNATGFKDVRVVRNIVRIGDSLQKQEEEIHTYWLKLLKEFAKLDAEGNFEPTKNEKGEPQMGTFQIRDDVLADGSWPKAQKEFSELTAEIHAKKLLLHELVNCDLSPAELSYLEPLLTDLAEEMPNIGLVKEN